MNLRNENIKMMGKLAVITVSMFAFGYALIPLYKHICEITGINILSLVERQVPGNGVAGAEARSAAGALSTCAPAPTTTFCPSVGWRLAPLYSAVPPSVTPW